MGETLHEGLICEFELSLGLSSKGQLLWRAGCCGGFVAQRLWRLQPETLGGSPSAASFFCFSPFSPSRLIPN